MTTRDAGLTQEEQVEAAEVHAAGSSHCGEIKSKSAFSAIRQCTIQTRMLLLIYCVHTQMLHLLRGIPPSNRLAGARAINETMRITVATITYTNPTLLEEAHNNKALAQLRLPPSLGGAGLSALASTYQAAYKGSVAGCLVRLSALPLLSAGCARDPGLWDSRPGPLGAVYEAWHRGVAGPPLSSLPGVKRIRSLRGDDDAPTLSISKLTCAPTKAQRAFPRALAEATHIAIASDGSVDPFVRIRVKVCASTGASDWLRALPGADDNGLLTDAQYAVCLFLFFGLPCKAIGPATTCVPTCVRASKAGDPDLQERGWFFGHHFFHCGAGSRLDVITNSLGGRHDAAARTLGNCFSELGFTVCSDKKSQKYALIDGRKIDVSIEDLSRNACIRAIDFTILNPWAHAADALASGAAYLAKHGDDAKVAKHACHVQAQGAQFVPASFSVLGAWGPAITARFDALWATEVQKAADNGDSTWPVIRRKLNQLAKQSLYHPDAGQRADAPLSGYSTGNLVPCSCPPRPRPASPSLLTPARPGLFTVAATSLTAVPSVLHAVAPRRVACELPGGIVLRSL
jgi:hypothetical protein